MRPQLALKISLLVNVVLLALAAWLLRPVPPAPAASAPATTLAVAVPDDEVKARESSPPFRWSQLESSNYLTYIANLRAIGCPAQTIRDLIVADVDSLYAPKREQLREQAARSGQNPESRLDELGRDESNLIARLLGLPQDAGLASTGTVASASQVQSPTTMPLAFVDLDKDFGQLNDRQKQVIGQMRRAFTEELGGQNADPASPEYAERWRKAQPEYDAQLRTLVNQDVFLELKREAAGTGQNH